MNRTESRLSQTMIVLASCLMLSPAAGAIDQVPTSEAGAIAVAFWSDQELPAVGSAYAGQPVVGLNAALHFIVVESQDLVSTVRWAALDPAVRYAERLGFVQPLEAPDPLLAGVWSLGDVGLPAAWQQIRGQQEKRVCIIDSGIRYTHLDLAPNIQGVGQEFVASHLRLGAPGSPAPEDTWDFMGHGTHVAGTVAAVGGNGLGVAGAGNQPITIVKVFDRGLARTDAIVDAIVWCADDGAAVITMSLGAKSAAPQVVVEAVDYAWSKGALVFAASANDGCQGCVNWPANIEDVIAVGCTSSDGTRCGFSNYGPELDIVAPGSNILSTCFESDDSYCAKSGTSMSTPLAAGIAALAWGARPALTNAQIRDLIYATADERGPPGWDEEYGHGRINASRLVSAVLAEENPALPSCRIGAPALGSVLGGITAVRVDVRQADARKVEIGLRVDGAEVGPALTLKHATEATVFLSMDTTLVADGMRSITATCTFAEGIGSDERVHRVSNEAPPAATLSLANGTMVAATELQDVRIGLSRPLPAGGSVDVSINGAQWEPATALSATEFQYEWDPFFSWDRSNVRVRVTDVDGETSFAWAFVSVVGIQYVAEALMNAEREAEDCAQLAGGGDIRQKCPPRDFLYLP